MVRRFVIDGLEYSVGQDAKENDKLLRDASQRDIWFHLQDNASPHGILKFDAEHEEQFHSKDVIQQCAALIKHFSKLSSMRSAKYKFLPCIHSLTLVF